MEYIIELTEAGDGAYSGSIDCVLSDRGAGWSVELTKEEASGLDEAGRKQAVYDKKKAAIDEWLEPSSVVAEGNFTPA